MWSSHEGHVYRSSISKVGTIWSCNGFCILCECLLEFFNRPLSWHGLNTFLREFSAKIEYLLKLYQQVVTFSCSLKTIESETLIIFWRRSLAKIEYLLQLYQQVVTFSC